MTLPNGLGPFTVIINHENAPTESPVDKSDRGIFSVKFPILCQVVNKTTFRAHPATNKHKLVSQLAAHIHNEKSSEN